MHINYLTIPMGIPTVDGGTFSLLPFVGAGRGRLAGIRVGTRSNSINATLNLSHYLIMIGYDCDIHDMGWHEQDIGKAYAYI